MLAAMGLFGNAIAKPDADGESAGQHWPSAVITEAIFYPEAGPGKAVR
jgi:hypothetical protein